MSEVAENKKCNSIKYNSILPVSADFMLEEYRHLRAKDPNRDKEYSPLHDVIIGNIFANLQKYTDYKTFHKAYSSSLFPERLSKAILRNVEEFVCQEGLTYAPQLLAENEALKEKLRIIYTILRPEQLLQIDQLLKPKP